MINILLVHLHDIPVNSNLTQICLHVADEYELHFSSIDAFSVSVTRNLICTPFSLVHILMLLFVFRWLGTLSNKQFSTEAQGGKHGSRYPFPMLTIHLFAFFHDKNAKFPNTHAEKKKRHRNNAFP